MILVTGATGNVGSELTRTLAARGESVRVLARQPDQASFPAGVQVAMGDLDDPEPFGDAGSRGELPTRNTAVVRVASSASACVMRPEFSGQPING